jgi:hypothetical protein
VQLIEGRGIGLVQGLKAEVLEVADYEAAVELYFQNNWTDGLAIVPPTEHKVQAMIDYVGRNPQEVLGVVPPRGGIVTVEKLATNAVMAGCKPEYFPVVLAAFDALIDPHHNLNGVQTTTHCCVSLMIINGPIVQDLNLNSHWGSFGSGYRANGTIGRAIRLILWNAGGNYPWEVDRSTHAHPGKWSYVLAENEPRNPWQPFSADRGFAAGTNTVTVFACESPHSILCYGTADEMLLPICSSMATHGNNNSHSWGETLLVLNPWNAEYFHAQGYSKEQVKQHIFENARLSRNESIASGAIARQMQDKFWPAHIRESVEDVMVPIVAKPEDIHIVVSGGERYFAQCCPGWGGPGGFAVTREIVLPR